MPAQTEGEYNVNPREIVVISYSIERVAAPSLPVGFQNRKQPVDGPHSSAEAFRSAGGLPYLGPVVVLGHPSFPLAKI
jgi:hypothetical protein